MARGRHTTLRPVLTPEERQALEACLHSHTITALVARRARLILVCADGLPIQQAAAQVGFARRHAYRWLQRWQAEGLAGLQDRPRPTDLTRQREAKARKQRERTACPT